MVQVGVQVTPALMALMLFEAALLWLIFSGSRSAKVSVVAVILVTSPTAVPRHCC